MAFRTLIRRASARSVTLLAASCFAVLLAIAAAAGCGTQTPTGSGGDATGTHLVAFASDRDKAPGQYDLWLWDFDALGFKPLPSGVNTGAAERHPTLSSDGRFLAYQVDRGTGSQDDIEMYDRLGNRFLNLPGLNTGDSETEPVFSGDGLSLCFVQGSATRRIRLYNGQTGQLVPLPGLDAPDPYSDYSPAPNYDGSVIAFVSNRNGNPDIFLYSRSRGLLDGPKLSQALRSGGEDLDPAFSGGGQYLAFSSDRPGSQGSHDVYLVQFINSPTVMDTALISLPLANSSSDERHPTLSNAGNILIFQSNIAGGKGRWDLWNFDRSLSPPEPPVQSPGYDSPGDDIEPSLRWP